MKRVSTIGNEFDSPSILLQNKLIFKKFRIISLISEGTFYYIYYVINVENNKYYAMKVEKKDSNVNLLKEECFNLFSIKGYGIPKLITGGISNKYYILIEELLGNSLNTIFLNHNKKFSIQDICLISIQLIDRIELLHSKFFIHRDIKPENFLIGQKNPNVIYLTEFGLCEKYCSSKTKKHIKLTNKGTFTGTLRYSSANAQKGLQQSRRDDLESLGYVILYFFRGKLPWEDFYPNLTEKEIYLKTFKMKAFMPLDKLCKNCPQDFKEYFIYVKKLKFQEDPDYEYLRNIFKKILKKEGVLDDYKNLDFSWVKNNATLKSSSKKKQGFKTRLLGKSKENLESKGYGINDALNKNKNQNENVDKRFKASENK